MKCAPKVLRFCPAFGVASKSAFLFLNLKQVNRKIDDYGTALNFFSGGVEILIDVIEFIFGQVKKVQVQRFLGDQVYRRFVIAVPGVYEFKGKLLS